jgi:hypothetical protein
MAHRLRLLAFLAIVSAIAMQLPADRARSAEPASQDAAIPGPSRETPSTLDTVTVQARRDREIKRQITKFVSGGVVTYFNDSLERWNQPICPLVAGVPSEQSSSAHGFPRSPGTHTRRWGPNTASPTWSS